MSNLERLKHESRMTVLNSRVVADRLRAEKLRDALRDLLDQTLPVEDLKGDDITSLALDFGVAHINLSEKLAQIAKIKEVLGK
jgi:hypothetical protein